MYIILCVAHRDGNENGGQFRWRMESEGEYSSL